MLVQGYPIGWFAPTYKILLDAWEQIVECMRPIIKNINQMEKRIECITGGVFEAWTLLDENAGRSRKYGHVIIDEAGLVKNLEQKWQLAIQPTLIDYRGGATLLGTPKGRNDLYRLFQRAETDPQWFSVQRPSDANPYLDPAELITLRETLPALAVAQELDAKFVSGEQTLFTLADIDACFVPNSVAAPKGHMYYVTAVDVGRRQDATIINTIDYSSQPYQRVAFERIERQSFPRIQQAITDRYKAYGGSIVVESNGIGDPVIENLTIPVMPFVTTQKSKIQALTALQILLQQHNLHATWDNRERLALQDAEWIDMHTADEVMSLAIAAQFLERNAMYSNWIDRYMVASSTA